MNRYNEYGGSTHMDGPGRNIAVIGTGISGLSAAWLLRQRHRVTVYESANRPGGHSNTVDAPSAKGPSDNN